MRKIVPAGHAYQPNPKEIPPIKKPTQMNKIPIRRRTGFKTEDLFDDILLNIHCQSLQILQDDT